MAPHYPSPAEAHGALAGEKSEAIRLAVRGHTHALFALKVQRKVSNGVAGLAAARSSLEARGPSCVSQTSQLTREQSGKSVRAFKGIFCDDISETNVRTAHAASIDTRS
jgi:hypothetical protein